MSRFDNNCLWITGSLDDGLAVASFINIVGGHGDLGHAGIADNLEPYRSDVAPDFDSIELFHKSEFEGWDGAALTVGASGRDKGRALRTVFNGT